MCPANGELENGDAEAPVDFLCRTAHLRAYTFGFPVAPHGECEYCAGGSRYDELMAASAALHASGPHPAAGAPAAPAADAVGWPVGVFVWIGRVQQLWRALSRLGMGDG